MFYNGRFLHGSPPAAVCYNIYDMALVSVTEAAKSAGISDARVRQLLAAHQILGQKYGGIWVLDDESLRQYLAKPQTRGRPRRNAPTDRSAAKRRQGT